jgi:antitoxin CptB
MPDSDTKSENRRKKLLFRSWHRGTREMDLLLGRFADRHIQTLSDDELDVFSAVLRCPDQDLYDWVIGKSPWPQPLQNSLTQRLTRFSTDQTDS